MNKTKDKKIENRLDQFKILMVTRFKTIISIGVLMILFFIPFIILNIVKTNYLAELISSLTALERPQTEILLNVRYNYLLFDLVQIVPTIIIFVGIAGSSKIIKNLCFDEPIMFWNNFKVGIKENWKNYSLISIFFSVTLAIFDFANNSSGLMESRTISMVAWFILGIFIFVLMPIFFITLSMEAMYTNKLVNSIKSSAVMILKHYLAYVFVPLTALIVFGVIFFLNFKLSVYVLSGVCLLLIMYLLPIMMLANHEFALSMFDKYINHQYPELLNKGLEVSKEEDKE